jgi:cyclic beta-1,2-glucan synthetase
MSKSAPFILPCYEKDTSVFFVKNPSHSFISASCSPSSATSDRSPITGRQCRSLSNTIEKDKDPCSALAYDIH